MKPLKKGEEVLRKAEAALQKLIAEAAESGDYEELGVLADWAKRIGGLAASQRDAPGVSTSDAWPHKPRQRRGRRGPASQYPQFSRAGDLLIKTSWSKKKRSEYEHKAPHQALTWMTKALSEADAARRPVPMDQLLPVVGDDGQEIPSYQAYLALSFLREQGIVTQVGRSGYKLEMPGPEAESAARDAWQQLSAQN